MFDCQHPGIIVSDPFTNKHGDIVQKVTVVLTDAVFHCECLVENTQHVIESAELAYRAPKMAAALQPFADLIFGGLDDVGGGTLVAPTIRVQMVKDARAALKE